MKTKLTNSLKAEKLKIDCLQSTRNNQICCSLEPNQKLNGVEDGTVRKRYQERLKSLKCKNVTHSQRINKEYLIDNQNALKYLFVGDLLGLFKKSLYAIFLMKLTLNLPFNTRVE